MNIRDELHRDDPGPEPLYSWEEAASGLDLHRLGVVFRVVVVVAMVIFALLQLGAKHADPGGFSLLLGLAEVITTIMSIVGISRFGARSPASIGGGMGFAVMCMVGVVLAEAWALWVVWRVIQFVDAVNHGHYPSLDGLEESAAHLPYVQVAAAVAGLIAILFVLAAIRRVGLAVGNEELADSAGRNQLAIMILAVGYGIVIKLATTSESNGALVLLLGLVIYALVVLISYIALLKRGVDAMRAPSHLPTASVR